MNDVNAEDLPVVPTIMRRGTALFSIPDAMKLLAYCEVNKIAVLGFDSFRIEGSMLCPDLDCIADFSSSLHDPSFVEDSANACRRILDSLNDKELLLEFVLITN